MGDLLCPRHPGQPRGFCPRCAAEHAANDQAPPDLDTAAHELAAAIAGNDVDGSLDLTAGPPVGRMLRIAEALTRFGRALVAEAGPPCCCHRENTIGLLRAEARELRDELEAANIQLEGLRRKLAEQQG